MLETLGAILSGGATGLLGTAISAGIGYVERRQRHQQELELRRIDLKMTEAEAASAERVAAIEAESAQSTAELRAIEQSHRQAGERWSSGDSAWLVAVDVVRGLIRPLLTVAFLALAAAIYFRLPAAAEAPDVAGRMIDTVLYLATTTTLWWFGTRPKHAPK